MSEPPTNTYNREHPGHAEPDRYLDDEGRCMFCGRVVAIRERDAALEALEEAQGKLEAAIGRGVGMWDYHRQLMEGLLAMLPDELKARDGRVRDRILRGSKEDAATPELTNG